MWRSLCEKYVVGPILYDHYVPEEIKDKKKDEASYSFEDLKYRLAIGPMCHILELLDKVCTPRLRQLRQRIIGVRRAAYKDNDWDKHALYLQMMSMQEL